MINSTQLYTALTLLLQDIKELNQLLLEDQGYFLHGNFEEIEQSAITKLTVKNRIDELISQYQVYPQWKQLTQDGLIEDSAYQECMILWEHIIDEININANLLQVNQQVVNKNQHFHQQIFHSLSQTNTNNAQMLYDKQAQLA